MEGQAEHVKQLTRDLKPFWQLRDDLCIEHGHVLFQGRFYISQTLRSHHIKKLHQGHPGITKMRLRVQTSMYWIGISKQIKDHVLHCVSCQTHSRSQEKSQPFLLKSPVDLGKS